LRVLPVLLLLAGGAWSAPAHERKLSVRSFQLVERASGNVNYYSVVENGHPPFIRSQYRPGLKTAVVGYELSAKDKRAAKRLSWQWRALKLPAGGDECVAARADSAAVVYVSWKRGLRWYTLKYVWSAVGAKTAVCDQKRNPLLAQDTVILETGGPVGEWRSVNLDLRAEFRKHFEGGDPNADVPELYGVGLMSDGDQTTSESSADFAEFLLR